MISLDTISYDLHSIQIKDADGDALAIGADGSLNITDNGGSLTVDATDLDIRDLAFATDKVDVSGSVVALDAPTLAALESITVQNGSGASAVNIQDGGNSITVDANNLDIRDLVFATDKVDVSASVIALDATTLAALETISVQSVIPGVAATNLGKAEDAAHTTGDTGVMGLAVRNDSLAALAGTDGDYIPLSTNAVGALWTVLRGASGNSLIVNTDGSLNVQTFEGGYSNWSVIAATINSTESQLAASPLTGRLHIEIQNLGVSPIFVRQSTGVSTSNGFKIAGGSSWDVSLDSGAAIYAITAALGSADVRIAQYAA